MNPQLFSEELIEIEPTSTSKGRMRENRVASDLISCGLLVYRLETVNGSPDFMVKDPLTGEVLGVEVTGAVPTTNGNGVRACGNKNRARYDVLALVDEVQGIIIYKPDRFRRYRRYTPRS